MKVMQWNMILSINKLGLAGVHLLVVHVALVKSSPLITVYMASNLHNLKLVGYKGKKPTSSGELLFLFLSSHKDLFEAVLQDSNQLSSS